MKTTFSGVCAIDIRANTTELEHIEAQASSVQPAKPERDSTVPSGVRVA